MSSCGAACTAPWPTARGGHEAVLGFCQGGNVRSFATSPLLAQGVISAQNLVIIDHPAEQVW